jgi:hypothetical protein
VRGEGDADDLARPLRDERLRRSRLGHVPRPLDVELGHRPEPLGTDRLGRSEELAAGVVDEQIEAPVTVEDGVDEGSDRVLVADVGDDGRRAPAESPDLLPGLLDRTFPAAAADDGRAEPRELQCGLAAEPGPGPGDEADAAVEEAGGEDLRRLRDLRGAD